MKRVLVLWFAAVALGSVGAARGDDGFYARPALKPNGDWATNAGPVVGTVPHGHLQAGALWRVTAPLWCRREPAPGARILRAFGRGTILQADVGRGGSDEVLYNAVDRNGDTWMRVRTRDGRDLDCSVRANRRWLVPLAH